MKEFYEEIKNLVNEHPGFSEDEAFTFWFVNYLHLDENLAENSITGMTGDKGIDALWIDDEAQTVNILQAKLREMWGKHSESRNDVLALLEIAKIFEDDMKKNSYFKGLDSKITRKLNRAVERVKERGYKINLHFITTGKISRALRQEANSEKINYDLYAHAELVNVWEDWEEGVAPAVGSYDLPIETGNFSSTTINRRDAQRDIDTWIVTVSSKNIGNMYTKIGKVLFAKNIRGFLGKKTPINESMDDTIKNEPENFWYYNNGITMVCDNCTETKSDGKTELHVVRPQIINGQQTTRTLSESFHTKAHVLLKVIKLPRKGDYGYSSYHKIVNSIVKATNWQNKISYEDLVSNDLFQVRLERKFRHLRYNYLRKRQKKSEGKDSIGYRPILSITKDSLAKSVAACTLEPSIVRLGKDALFDQDRYYKQIFDKTDPDFYLSCFHILKFVDYHKKNNLPNRYHSYYSNWLVIHFIWNGLGHVIDSGENAKKFRQIYRARGANHNKKIYSEDKANKIIEKIVYFGFKMTKTYYKTNKKIKGGGETSENDFFKRGDLWKNFSNYSKTKNKKEWREFENLVKNFQSELKLVKLV